MIFPASQIVTHQDKHWIYYNGYRERHGIGERGPHGIGLATLKLDRFIGLQARGESGTVVTKPFVLQGNGLEMNLDARAGAVRVELLDQNANPLPGFAGANAPTYKDVDDLRFKPAWKGHKNLSALRGKVVRVRFTLHNAKLYAFQIGVGSPFGAR